MSLPGFSRLGHVGIWTGKSVLEVLPITNNVVQKNTISRFRSSSDYWGARYGLANKVASIKAIEKGWIQKRFNPKYVYSSRYTESMNTTLSGPIDGPYRRYGGFRGGLPKNWISIRGIKRGKFRCDTFLVYSFSKGGASSYSNLFGRWWNNTTTPRRVFHKNPHKRS